MPSNPTQTTGLRTGEPAMDGRERLGALHRDINLHLETLRLIMNAEVREEAADMMERLCQHYADETERLEAEGVQPKWSLQSEGLELPVTVDSNEARRRLRTAQMDMNALAQTKNELEALLGASDALGDGDVARGVAAMGRNLVAAEAQYLDMSAEFHDALLHELMGAHEVVEHTSFDLMQPRSAQRGRSLRN